MRKMVWGGTVLLGGILLMGTLVTAQEKRSEPAVPQMQEMGQMMGMGMMGHSGQMRQMGQMGSMMEMMQGMMQMMDNCNQMMGGSPSTEQGGKK